MNTRLLGTACMIGSSLCVLDALRISMLGGSEFDTVNLAAGTVWAVGGICGLLGMLSQRATGRNVVARVLTFVPIAGFGLLIVADVLQLAGVFTAANNSAAGIAWIALLAGMMLVGILTIAARQWQGWQRFIPLLTVIAVPLGFGLGAAIGGMTLGTALLYVTWILLGYAVFTGGRTAVLRPAQA